MCSLTLGTDYLLFPLILALRKGFPTSSVVVWVGQVSTVFEGINETVVDLTDGLLALFFCWTFLLFIHRAQQVTRCLGRAGHLMFDGLEAMIRWMVGHPLPYPPSCHAHHLVDFAFVQQAYESTAAAVCCSVRRSPGYRHRQSKSSRPCRRARLRLLWVVVSGCQTGNHLRREHLRPLLRQSRGLYDTV